MCSGYKNEPPFVVQASLSADPDEEAEPKDMAALEEGEIIEPSPRRALTKATLASLSLG